MACLPISCPLQVGPLAIIVFYQESSIHKSSLLNANDSFLFPALQHTEASFLHSSDGQPHCCLDQSLFCTDSMTHLFLTLKETSMGHSGFLKITEYLTCSYTFLKGFCIIIVFCLQMLNAKCLRPMASPGTASLDRPGSTF